MHALFITRGIKQSVEHLIMDMQAQKHKVPVYNGKTKQVEHQWIQGALRPIQLWEYIFPEEDKDLVLTTLNFDNPLGQVKNYKMQMCVAGLRKMLQAEKIPEFKKDNHYLWIKKDVDIVPIGVKYDDKFKNFKEVKDGEFVETIHEAL